MKEVWLMQIRITRVETRSEDAWFDLSLRQLRRGEVSFYRVKDFLTGEWLFKVCRDRELGKVLVKAVKCPSGSRFAQLEGNSMVFQESVVEGMLYDVLSLMQADENDRLSRKVVSSVEEVPSFIKENFEIKTYEEATGRTAPGKNLVTLCRREDERAMITLFLFERAWTVSPLTPEEKLKTMEEQEAQQPRAAKKEIDTGQVWTCPICGKQHRLVHVETEKAVRHALFRV
jgi:rubrerythrin